MTPDPIDAAIKKIQDKRDAIAAMPELDRLRAENADLRRILHIYENTHDHKGGSEL